MQLSQEETEQIVGGTPCSSLTISFKKDTPPIALLERIFGEFPQELIEDSSLESSEGIVTFEARCYDKTCFTPTREPYACHVICFYSPTGTNCYGPFAGTCVPPRPGH